MTALAGRHRCYKHPPPPKNGLDSRASAITQRRSPSTDATGKGASGEPRWSALFHRRAGRPRHDVVALCPSPPLCSAGPAQNGVHAVEWGGRVWHTRQRHVTLTRRSHTLATHHPSTPYLLLPALGSREPKTRTAGAPHSVLHRLTSTAHNTLKLLGPHGQCTHRDV